MVSSISRSVSNHRGVNARVTNVVVRLFKYVALRSILSTSLRVTKSTRPTPVALPCEASERSSTETYRMRGLSISGSPVMRSRPMILVSTPVPLKFFPISSTMRPCSLSVGRAGMSDFDHASSRISSSMSASAGIALMRAVSS